MAESTAMVITMLDMLERPANKRGPNWLTAQKGGAHTSWPHTAVLSGFRSGPKRPGILRPSPVSEESAPEDRNKLFCMHAAGSGAQSQPQITCAARMRFLRVSLERPDGHGGRADAPITHQTAQANAQPSRSGGRNQFSHEFRVGGAHARTVIGS